MTTQPTREPPLPIDDAQQIRMGQLINALLAEVYRAPAASLPRNVRDARAVLILEAAVVVQQGRAQKAA